jgi:hypothetical protein
MRATRWRERPWHLSDSRGVVRRLLADRPLDENEGADGDVVLELDVPEPLFIEYEWVEEGKTYREALIPAERLNAYSETARLLSEEGDRRAHECSVGLVPSA